MKVNYLKIIRVFSALIFFVAAGLLFVDFAGWLPSQWHSILHLQLVPAFLAGMAIVVISLLILTFVFGRIYCSVICPAGVLQDVFARASGRGKKKNKHKRWYAYHKPLNGLRYVLLGVIVILLLAGSSELLMLLDPYSNFGRIVSNLVRPAVIFFNNLLAEGLALFNNYDLYHVSIFNITWGSVLAAAVILIVFFAMAFRRGRLFCNSLCPVGGLLSLVSRYSLFRITFDEQTCNSCSLCERSCKAECIDSKAKTVDASRCVDCFNCISSCTKGGLKYRFAPRWLKKEKKETPASPDAPASKGRRDFMATSALILSSFPAASALGMESAEKKDKPLPITPPGSLSRERFSDKCTACQLCITQCPNQILEPAGFEFGLDYLLKPHVVYDHGYCNYECTVCTEVCPNLALKDLTVEEKVTTQIGVAHFERDLCVVYNDNTDCGACSEHCPTQAVRMVPYKGTLRIPQVDPEICVGCGGCEFICPVRPQRAIHVVANPVHRKVEKPKEEEVKEFQIDDFGF